MRYMLSLFTFAGIGMAQSYCPPRAATPAEQSKIFNEFIDTFINKGNAIAALQTHAADTYIQHNPAAMSGRDATIEFFKSFSTGKPAPPSKRTIINQAFSDNKGFVHYKTETQGSKSQAIVDVYRMDGTCVMEHWDVIQARPDNPKNPLAMWSP